MLPGYNNEFKIKINDIIEHIKTYGPFLQLSENKQIRNCIITYTHKRTNKKFIFESNEIALCVELGKMLIIKNNEDELLDFIYAQDPNEYKWNKFKILY